ncbi:hypothetical protein EGT50_01650 [Rhodococcus xishaensis]|uniref:Uncharacterized protein n=1 Tax=Rhodococcus xishaensis TaxID=2487364 RepID=A0A438B315_9NOCA|nr:hypothetical protein EGT50_01650 [Rhodococcus xishaensis]
MAATISSVQLSDGASLLASIWIGSEPEGYAATIDICDPSVKSADDLRPIATEYAQALNVSPIAEQVRRLTVASYQIIAGTDGTDLINLVELSNSAFQLYPWDDGGDYFWKVVAG